MKSQNRRQFLYSFAVGGYALYRPMCSTSKGGIMAVSLRRKEVLVKAVPGRTIFARSFYTRSTGFEVLARWDSQAISDLPSVVMQSFSKDNGRSWGRWAPLPVTEEVPSGIYYHGYGVGWPDPISGRLLSIDLDAIMPAKITNAEDFDYQRFLSYRVSVDGGHTSIVQHRVIEEGPYNAQHPIDGVWIGKNSFAPGMNIIYCNDGRIMCPLTILPLGNDGKLYNPDGGMDYDNACVLIGNWNKDATIKWERSELIPADPTKTTRGWLEPTIAQMPDGRLLMVMRGSNGVIQRRGNAAIEVPMSLTGRDGRIRIEMQGHKWYTVSEDGGYHWSQVKPWTYNDGGSFYSPSSCSLFVPHSSGQLFWIGNIIPENPIGDDPRYMLVLGRVDPKSLLLMRESTAVIDHWTPQDSSSLELSNFWAREDRENGDIILNLTRDGSHTRARGNAAMIYHIQVRKFVK